MEPRQGDLWRILAGLEHRTDVVALDRCVVADDLDPLPLRLVDPLAGRLRDVAEGCLLVDAVAELEHEVVARRLDLLDRAVADRRDLVAVAGPRRDLGARSPQRRRRWPPASPLPR